MSGVRRLDGVHGERPYRGDGQPITRFVAHIGLCSRQGTVTSTWPALGGDALQPGDVIHAVNRSPVGGLTALRGALDRIGSGQVVVLQVERASELLFLTFTVDR